MTTTLVDAGVETLTRFAWRTDGSESMHIEASPKAVYDRIADVTRTGEQSLECERAEWVAGVAPGTVGARFRGRNKSGLARWTRTCEVVEASRGERFAFRTLPERFDVTRKDSTVWGYTIEADDDGCVVTHYYRIVRRPAPGLRQLLALAFPHHRDMRPHLEHTLRAVKKACESS